MNVLWFAELIAAATVGGAAGYLFGRRSEHRAISASVQRAPKLFLSYRRADSAAEMRELYKSLATLVGEENIFRDLDIEAGRAFPAVLNRALKQCDAVVALIGPDWIGEAEGRKRRRIEERGDWVRLEIVSAFRRKVRVLPVTVRGGAMPDARMLPGPVRRLCSLQAIAVSGDDYQRAARDIAARIGFDRRGTLAHRMRDEHDSLVERYSSDFWAALHAAFDAFAKEKQLNISLQQFLLAAGAPPHLDRGAELLDYDLAEDNADQKQIWEFARRCYPNATAGDRDALAADSLAPTALFVKFNEARSRFCGFWDSWATQRNIPAIALEYSGDAALIVANTWLDITHRQWTGERNKPKPGLARLCVEVVDLQRRLARP